MVRQPSGKRPSSFPSRSLSEAAQWWADQLGLPVDEADVLLVCSVPQCGFRLTAGPCLRQEGHGNTHRPFLHLAASPWPTGGPAAWDYQEPEDEID
jgi:hypothetical protein